MSTGDHSKQLQSEPDEGKAGQPRKARRIDQASERPGPEDVEAEETVYLRVYRYDPEAEGKQEPRFDDFHVPYERGMTVLDALIYARDHSTTQR